MQHVLSTLVDRDGQSLNTILTRAQRDFTLLYLRHSIDGKAPDTLNPVDEHDRLFLDRKILPAPKPTILHPNGHRLTLVPNAEEVAEHSSQTLEIRPFIQRKNDLSVAQLAKASTVEVLDRVDQDQALVVLGRSHMAAFSAALERTLECARKQDVEEFCIAQRDLEGCITVGIQTINTFLAEHDVLWDDRNKYLGWLTKKQVSVAVDSWLNFIPDTAEREQMAEKYEVCLQAYKASKEAAPEDRSKWLVTDEMRAESLAHTAKIVERHLNTGNDNPERSLPKRVFSAPHNFVQPKGDESKSR